ncbi:hypothetical protein EJ04DRAFT_555402 [Polyplosphaeria fusca]|uniref:HNH endonuclease n=1 Tax=Polyplosphaeria fusca TaxID=682080 RepID=A0A9P4QN32_9PLEO|nr:hypothetical protein EJ04DRAFT_555402 [Polyplosphaeria fusca]
MASEVPPDEQSNYETFRECMSEPILKALAQPVEKPKSRKRNRKTRSNIASQDPDSTTLNEANDPEDLADFIDYLSTTLFLSLPHPLRTLTHKTHKSTPSLYQTYTLPLPPSTLTTLLNTVPPPFTDTLLSLSLLPSPSSLPTFLLPIYTSYITATTCPPPIWSTTRTAACEMCGRDWIPLTYHHLIPRSTHAKVVKRGWHAEEQLGSVAWLCRACHSFVHGVAGNEELAREWWSVGLLMGREDVKEWVKWVGRVRWKAR